MLNKESATSLAVTYAAFMEAFNMTLREDIGERERASAIQSRAVWAKLLDEAQQETGVTLSTTLRYYYEDKAA